MGCLRLSQHGGHRGPDWYSVNFETGRVKYVQETHITHLGIACRAEPAEVDGTPVDVQVGDSVVVAVKGGEETGAHLPDRRPPQAPVPVRERYIRSARLSNSRGIFPFSRYSRRSSSITRPLLSAPTPCHSFKGVPVSQPAFRPVVAIGGVVQGNQGFPIGGGCSGLRGGAGGPQTAYCQGEAPRLPRSEGGGLDGVGASR